MSSKEDSLRAVILSDIEQADEAPSNPLDPSSTDDVSFPDPTTWEISSRCCCCDPCIRVKADPDRMFWGHWERSLCMPIFVLFLISFTLLTYFLLIWPGTVSVPVKAVAPIELAIVLVLFLWSYFSAACSDPGFLPYDWVRLKKWKYSWSDQMTGIGIRQDQIEFAKKYRPPFACFSKSAGRFVIRGDHICGWIANWVGKRNHKQFMLMNFWGSLYSISIFVWNLFGAERLSTDNLLKMTAILVAFGMEGVFGFALMFVFGVTLHDLRKNVTKIQKWKAEQNGEGSENSYGCCQSMREVCGDGTWLCWFIPIHAFGDELHINDDEFPPEDAEPTY